MKKAFLLTYLIVFFLILATCAKKMDQQEAPVIPPDDQEQMDLVKAKQLVETTCVSCHSATASEENRLAPPLEAVKRRYLRAYPQLDDFTTNIADFVAHPTEEKVLMFGAVNRFDVMPPIPFPEEDLKAIATYMYQFELERPDWFEEHYQEMHGANGNRNGRGNGRGNGMRRGTGGN